MILDYDPFGKDRMVYTFRNCCVEDPAIPYKDGLTIMIFNTTGTIGGSQEIKNMLDYIQNNNVSDSTTKQLNGFVNYVKSDPFVQEGIMTLGEHYDMEREKGRAEGRAEGKKESIFKVLENMGTVDDDICNYIDRISDPNELDKLLLAAAKATDIQEFKSAMK